MGIGGLTCGSGAAPSPAHLSGSERAALLRVLRFGLACRGGGRALRGSCPEKDALAGRAETRHPAFAGCYKTKRTLRKSGASVKFCNSLATPGCLFVFRAEARWFESPERKVLHSRLCRSFRMTVCCAASFCAARICLCASVCTGTVWVELPESAWQRKHCRGLLEFPRLRSGFRLRAQTRAERLNFRLALSRVAPSGGRSR
jgi:hypothetical protein